MIEQYALDHSSEYDQKSVSWAARQLLAKILAAEGYTPSKAEGDEEAEP